MMRVSKTWHQFKIMLDQAHPKRGIRCSNPICRGQNRRRPIRNRFSTPN